MELARACEKARRLVAVSQSPSHRVGVGPVQFTRECPVSRQMKVLRRDARSHAAGLLRDAEACGWALMLSY